MKNSNLIIMFAIMLVPCCVNAFQDADERPHGIFETRSEYHQFMGALKMEAENNPDLRAMVPLINDAVLQQPIGSTGRQYNATSSTFGLLADEGIRKELEILDEQYEELKVANATIQKRFVKKLAEVDFADMKNFSAQIMQIRDQSEQDLQATLLPHQMDRLRQLLAQRQLRRRSLVEIITSDPMKTQLEISDQQSAELKSAESKIEKELQQQIAKLRKQARKRLLARLNKIQQSKIEEMFGESLEVETTTLDVKKYRSKKNTP